MNITTDNEWHDAAAELTILFRTESTDVKRMTTLLDAMDKYSNDFSITQSLAAEEDVTKFMLISSLCLLLEDLETETEKDAAIAGFKIWIEG